MPNLETTYCGLKLRSPIVVSSAGITETVERMRKCAVNGAGAVVMKSYFEHEVSRTSPTPHFRILHHSMGREKAFTLMSYEQASQWDIDRYAEELAKAKSELPELKIFPSINCITDEGWALAARKVVEAGAEAIELNTSCPHGSITFRGGAVEEAIFHTVKIVREAVDVPLAAKISPMLTSPGAVAKRLEEIGVQAVTIFNRSTGLDVDIDAEAPVMHKGYAGHGGPWAIQYPLRWISQARGDLRIDIAGSGGVASWQDVVKYLLVGANVIQICSVIIVNGYEVIGELLEGLGAWMEKKGYSSLDEFRGRANAKILGTEAIDRRQLYRAEPEPGLDAPCRIACPVHVPVQAYVRLTAEGRFAEALEAIRSCNPFQSVCGYVCYHPCEEACTRGLLDAPINIRGVKRFLCEWGRRNPARKPSQQATPTGRKVAVVGAGPAGLTAANDLAARGHSVTVHDKMPEPGGMLRYGIPSYRLPRDVLDEEIDGIRARGVRIVCGSELGDKTSLDELRRDADAVVLALGNWKSATLGIPGEDGDGVFGALEFLRKVNQGQSPALPARTAVIGGGDTALDAARCALRSGAREAFLVYRRTRLEMPADAREIAQAEKEGVRILYLAKPVEILRGAGTITALKCLGGYLDAEAADGRRRPVPIPETSFELPVEAVIVAASQRADLACIGDAVGAETAETGVLPADPITGMTSTPGVFAAGDATGASASVIEAVASGKRAAACVDTYLQTGSCEGMRDPLAAGRQVDKLAVLARNIESPRRDRTEAPLREEAGAPGDFGLIERTLSEEEVRREAQRCLACGCGVGCGLCSRICIYDAMEQQGLCYVNNPDKCKGCGLCVELCPHGNIKLVEVESSGSGQ